MSQPAVLDGVPDHRSSALAYDTWVAQEVRSLGMAVFEKNVPEQAGQLEPYFDGVIDEQCNQIFGGLALSAAADCG